MNLKRSIFALIVCIFALCGFVSTYANVADNEIVLANLSANDKTDETNVTYEVVSKVTDLKDDPGLEYKEYDGREGVDWLASLTFEGSSTKIVEDYYVAKDIEGNILSETAVIGSKRTEKRKPAIMQFGSTVQEGAVFFPRTTTYGVDCYGCYNNNGLGSSAMSIKLHANGSVQQPNGQMKKGLKYGDYYVVAASPSIPICSVIEVSNHGYSGSGLDPNSSFKAIVLDRGGGVNNAHLDLFVGSEASPLVSINRRIHNPKAKIIRVGGYVKKGVCAM